MGGRIPPANHVITQMVKKSFGSYEELRRTFLRESLKLQGNDWAWLVYNEKTDALEHRQTLKFDTPSNFDEGLTPLLNIALWSFDTYKDYSAYHQQIWDVMNWSKADERFKNRNKAMPSE